MKFILLDKSWKYFFIGVKNYGWNSQCPVIATELDIFHCMVGFKIIIFGLEIILRVGTKVNGYRRLKMENIIKILVKTGLLLGAIMFLAYGSYTKIPVTCFFCGFVSLLVYVLINEKG